MRQVALFAAISGVVAAASVATAGAVAVLLAHDGSRQALLRLLVARYSPDGVISPEGTAILLRSLSLVMWASMAAAVTAGLVAVLLRRLARSQPVPDDEPGGVWAQRDAGRARSRVLVAATAAVLLAGAAALRAPRLSASLFYDEIFSLQHFAGLPALQILFAQEGFNNHILNSLLLRVVASMSSAETLLRLPVYLAGLVSLWAFFWLGRRLGGALTGFIALWMAAVNPYHLQYSTLARGYILGLALVLLGLCAVFAASRPPRRASRWSFGITQVLASLAMPTLMLVPAVLAGCLLAGVSDRGRRIIGVDPRSPTGSAWLSTALWTLGIALCLNVSMAPYLIRLLGEGGAVGIGGSSLEAAGWFGRGIAGSLGAAGTAGLAALGMAVVARRRHPARPWPDRYLLALAAVSLVLLVVLRVPARAHVAAFLGTIIFAALGLKTLVTGVASRRIWPRPDWATGVLALACVAALTLVAWGDVTAAARGTPLHDVRGAVRAVEAALPLDDGRIVTSGFTQREIGYYATRPVRWLGPADDPRSLVEARQPFCYFRLYADAGDDPVFRYFASLGPASFVVPGREAISVWCFPDGVRVLAARGGCDGCG